MLSNSSELLVQSELQFGNSRVCCTFLDAMKEFDRVDYCQLFPLLIRHNLPSLFYSIVLNFYINNIAHVSWCNYFYFKATNSIKQGGVLSPVLFCVLK